MIKLLGDDYFAGENRKPGPVLGGLPAGSRFGYQSLSSHIRTLKAEIEKCPQLNQSIELDRQTIRKCELDKKEAEKRIVELREEQDELKNKKEEKLKEIAAEEKQHRGENVNRSK